MCSARTNAVARATAQRVRAVRSPLRRRAYAARRPRFAGPQRRRAPRRSDDPPRHVDLHPLHALRAGVRRHPGGRRARCRVARRAHGDRRGRRRRPRQGRLHVVRRVRARLSHWRDLRGPAPAALHPRADPHPRAGRGRRLPLLRRRLPGQPARRRRADRPRDVPRHRARHPESGVDVREGSLRLRLPPAPRPPHEAADPEGLDQGGRPLDLEGRYRSGSSRRPVADHRG